MKPYYNTDGIYIIHKSPFYMVVGQPTLPKELDNPDALSEYIREKYGDEFFYKDGEIKCSPSVDKLAYDIMQEWKYRYECNHGKKVTKPECPVCKEPNIVVIMPNEKE